jgi:hypothetical protein
MLDEYSIEQRATQIFDYRSKEYFSEVLSCYSSGSYRSAVVMLWSVVVCDLVFKLNYLDDLYKDEKAKNILQEVGESQKQNDKKRLSDWESELVELIFNRTQLLDIAEHENLINLKKQRNLAAHPVINTSLQLHRPNRDTTRALIRNALDGVLTKSPVLSKKIVGDLMKDLETASKVFSDNNDLRLYLESKYFSKFDIKTEIEVFKALWKFVFNLTNEECEKNRDVNFKALSILHDRNKNQFLSQIKNEIDYFSSIAPDSTPIKYLIRFLSGSPKIYEYLADHAKATIKNIAERQESSQFQAWFIHGSLNKHAAYINELITENKSHDIEENSWKILSSLSESHEWSKHVIQLGNSYYGASEKFDTADKRFAEVIRPKLDQYDINDCIDLIDKSEENNQTYGRGRAAKDHQLVIDRVNKVSPGFDCTKYKKFMEQINK